MRSTRTAFVAILMTGLASGCYQQQLRLAVHENGAGTIQITERIDPPGATLLLPSDATERESRIRGALIQELASWDGVCAWRDAGARVDGGSVVLAAKGYFEDVSVLGRDGLDALTHSFAFRRQAAITSLEWTLARRPAPPADTLERCRAIVKSLRSTRIEAEVTFPGAFLMDEYATSKPSGDKTSWVLFSGAQLAERLDALEARLAAGEITEADVVRQVQSELTRTFTARCRSSESENSRERFLAELEDATILYSGTELAREIEAARKHRDELR